MVMFMERGPVYLTFPVWLYVFVETTYLSDISFPGFVPHHYFTLWFFI